MEKRDAARRVAIVGFGPRGLGALEALSARASAAGREIAVDLFDTAVFGAGPNYAPDQSPLCLLNIPVRAIEIGPGPTGFPTFADSPGATADPERYPSRAELGAWLAARFEALAKAPGPLRIEGRKLRVRAVAIGPEGWSLETETGARGPYAEVLLTPGQPETAPDAQLARWRDHADRHGLGLVPVYPDARLRAAAGAWVGRSVAIRGLGLATLDALRLLTRGAGGRFENGRYQSSGREPARILPFSLDGRPPTPKPATAALDARFDPLPAETAAFEDALARAVVAEPDAALEAVCAPLAAAAGRVLRSAGGIADPEAWIAVERSTPGAQETRPAVETLRAGVAMARGAAAPDAGFAVGQLWRKWQNALRRGYNSAAVAPATAAALTGFDEGLKRYSYGPPVASAEELQALIAAGIVDLRAVADPDVVLHDRGWRLVEDDATAEAEAMIDAVLPPPELGRIAAPEIEALRHAGRAVTVAKGLGARTLADGQLVGRDGAVQPGLCLLGRLALGSVIAVDSLHDCFGASAGRWAEGVIARGR